MKRKEVEDVIGGKDAWENVDKADGELKITIAFERGEWGGKSGSWGRGGRGAKKG